MGTSGADSSPDRAGQGSESARLRAALDREGARRVARGPERSHQGPAPVAYRGEADSAGLASVRERAWLIPKGPFIAMGRLVLALAGIAGLVILGLLAASGIALVQLHFQMR